MKLKFTLIALLFGASMGAFAQDAKTYDTNEEMQEQMRMIVNELGLDVQKAYDLGQIMNAKKEQKEESLQKIENIKQQMNNAEMNAEKQIQGMLTEEQWEKYKKDIKPKLQAEVDKKMAAVK